MTSKMKLLASAAIAAVSLVSAPVASANNWYVNVSGGANWLGDNSFYKTTSGSTTTTFSFDNDTKVGFILSGAVGMHLDGVLPGLRAEGELAYRENDVGGFWSTCTDETSCASNALDYQHSTFSILANAWYDFQVAGLNPYVGGGLGWADTELDGTFNGKSSALSESDSGFAWQLGGGLNFDIQPNMKLGIGYRYFVGPDVSIHAPYSDNPLTGNVDSENQSVTVGLTVGL
ncbi:MAG: outer membrane beta-barrel protein [Micropepsaceae bacterium]